MNCIAVLVPGIFGTQFFADTVLLENTLDSKMPSGNGGSFIQMKDGNGRFASTVKKAENVFHPDSGKGLEQGNFMRDLPTESKPVKNSLTVREYGDSQLARTAVLFQSLFNGVISHPKKLSVFFVPDLKEWIFIIH